MIAPHLAVNLFPQVHQFINKINAGKDPEGLVPEKAAGTFDVYSSEGVRLELEENEPTPEGSVGVLEIVGTMIKYGTWCSWGANELCAQIDQWAKDPNIKGVILRGDSGGGAVDAVPVYLQALARLKAAGKPSVFLADLCASACYYVAVHTDYIMAENNVSAEFGSIGVMVSFADYTKYYKKHGVKLHVVYAPESTHKNQAFENALKGDYKTLKEEMLSPLAIGFQNAVKSQMPGLNLDIEGILNGRMFYADQALEYGMIHGIGSLSDAIAKIDQLAAGKALKGLTL